jgi:hypothetical protein
MVTAARTIVYDRRTGQVGLDANAPLVGDGDVVARALVPLSQAPFATASPRSGSAGPLTPNSNCPPRSAQRARSPSVHPAANCSRVGAPASAEAAADTTHITRSLRARLGFIR